jgi:archaellum component FlaF (FlaF/FlaG flagellin family)
LHAACCSVVDGNVTRNTVASVALDGAVVRRVRPTTHNRVGFVDTVSSSSTSSDTTNLGSNPDVPSDANVVFVMTLVHNTVPSFTLIPTSTLPAPPETVAAIIARG